ncbi:MAG: efflux RND transporter periplasmic adaptor subunit [Ignavibacteriales bacterium]|nr:efflux RND transporter periplasmic adaptor subunit [Ignavibacteriales bacterium]
MKNKSFRLLFIITALAIVIVAAKFLFFPGKSKAETGAARAKFDLRINGLVLVKQQLSDTLAIAGSILPEELTDLSFEASGKLIAISFNEGTFVKKGSRLAKINDADLQAELQKAMANKKLQEQREERARALLKKDGISKEEYDQINNAGELARAQVALLTAQIAKTELSAPYDGYVGMRLVGLGQYIVPTMVISSFSKLQTIRVEGALPESYFGLLKPGDIIHFQPSNLGRYLTAKIYAIEPKISSESRTFVFRAKADNPGAKIPSGGFAKILLKLNHSTDGFIIPAESLVPDAKGYVAYVFDNGKVKEKRVQLLRRDAENSYISEGLGYAAVIHESFNN